MGMLKVNNSRSIEFDPVEPIIRMRQDDYLVEERVFSPRRLCNKAVQCPTGSLTIRNPSCSLQASLLQRPFCHRVLLVVHTVR